MSSSSIESGDRVADAWDFLKAILRNGSLKRNAEREQMSAARL
jgi:hypothetical protein